MNNAKDILVRIDEKRRDITGEEEDAYEEIVRLRRAVRYAMKYCDRDTFEVLVRALRGCDDF